MLKNQKPQFQLIYLNGPSSAGKTTIAKALQEAFCDPFLHIGIDRVAEITNGQTLELKTEQIPSWFKTALLNKVTPESKSNK